MPADAKSMGSKKGLGFRGLGVCAFCEGLPVSPRLMVFINTLYDAMGNILYFVLVFFVVLPGVFKIRVATCGRNGFRKV